MVGKKNKNRKPQGGLLRNGSQGGMTNRVNPIWNLRSGAFPNLNLFKSATGGGQVYSIVAQTAAATLMTTSNSVITFGSQAFALSGLNNVAGYTAVFDQYKITKIEAWIYAIESATVGEPVLGAATWLSVVDYDDNTALASYNKGTDYKTCYQSNLTDGHYRCFVPHVAVAVYSGTFTSFKNEVADWIDSASTGVQHYGIKTASNITPNPVTVQAIYRYHVSFRNTF